jgi:mannose-1-phosphate guanylyltransferase
MESYYAVVMAGGGGTRFWPRSRQTTPKQLLAITGEKALIAQTVERLNDGCPAEQTLIITNAKQRPGTLACVPELPEANIIGEPIGRNTAPCVGLAALIAQVRSGDDPVVGVYPADQCIKPVAAFTETVQTAVKLASESAAIVTIGVKPSYAATGFGYIQHGEELSGTANPAYDVQAFKEKPDTATAEQFVASGEYSWNAGMFFFRASTVLNELERQQPEIFAALELLRSAIGTDKVEEALAAAYEAMPSISFDYAVMEQAPCVQVVQAAFDWDDVGSWAAMARHFPADADGNVVRGEAIAIDSHNNTVDSKRLVALVGVDDLVVVETDDSILVCKRDAAEDVKQVVERLKADGRNELL